jgi:N,N'-diacetylchitobiose transport system substrate-binding protein
MNKKLSALALVTVSALALGACAGGPTSSPSATESTAAAGPQNITLWLAGGDTPDALRDYLKTGPFPVW